MLFPFEYSYRQLPALFHAQVSPTPVDNPTLLLCNYPLIKELGGDISAVSEAYLRTYFSGNILPKASQPYAMAYAGHQFGSFVPQLGDGRAIVLGEVVDKNNKRWDIQLKGAGITPFSRRGDGRAPLGAVLREYIVSEAMHALGIPTTRALAAIATGEFVYRESPVPGGVFTRVAASHIRIGTFEYAAVRSPDTALPLLADYVIDRHYPFCKQSSHPYIALFEHVMHAQASLIALWMKVGFVHGVMNTDNMSISGETIDYGPCAFIDRYHPQTVFSSIDIYGRYAYDQQPHIAQWNLARLAETLLPLFDKNKEKAVAIANEQIAQFPLLYEHYWLEAMRHKMGFVRSFFGEKQLITHFLTLLESEHIDFTLGFRRLSRWLTQEEVVLDSFSDWVTQWKSMLQQQGISSTKASALMSVHNPVYIPRNHLVEEAIQHVLVHGDLTLVNRLMSLLSSPFNENTAYLSYAEPPVDQARYRTFCGT